MTPKCYRNVCSLLTVAVKRTSGFRVPLHGRPFRSGSGSGSRSSSSCCARSRHSASIASTKNEINYMYIDTDETFWNACDQWNESSALAFDIECEFNRHRYGTHLCLIQLSDGDNIFIVDPTAIQNLDPLWDILESENEVIVHSPGSDISLLDKIYGRRPTNLFCTEMAARLLGYEKPSLSFLLEKYFGKQKQETLSTSDWFQRPLSRELLKYAALDVAFLHQLKAILVSELKEKSRLQWHEEECNEMKQFRYRESINPHLRIKGSKNLSYEEAHVLKHLFEVREEVAKDTDKPPSHIIPNTMLLHLAQNPPARLHTWKTMKGVHPYVRKQYSVRFHQAVMDAKTSTPEQFESTSSGDILSDRDETKAEILEQIRTRISIDYPDVGNLVLSKRASDRLAAGHITLLDLRNWQRTIVLRIGMELDLDMSLF